MPGGEVALLDEPLDLLGEGQKAHDVGDGGAGSAHPLGGFLLGQAVVLDKGAVACGFLHRVQVLPLEVFDQAQLHDHAVVGLDDDGWDLGKARHAGGPPPAFSGDDLVVA